VSDRTCALKGCDRPHRSNGWCNMHYTRWRKWGTPLQSGPAQLSNRERLLNYVTVAESGCWQWRHVHPDGYSIVVLNGVRKMAHRAVYEELVGPIPDGATLDHTCHTEDLTCPGGSSCSHRSCVNPEHLEPVPHGENVRRSRHNNWEARKTHCPQGHPYSGTNLRYGSRGCRVCRKCEQASKRRYLARQAEKAALAAQ
jgi:hypothetical protein